MVIILPILGFFLIFACGSLIWWWEMDGQERYFYQNVIVLSEDAKRGQIINESMISVLKVESTKKIANAITNKSDIVNMAAKHYIPKLTQLDPQYFDKKELVTVGNQMIVKIPNEWLYSVPNTIRKNDTVHFYEVSKDILNLDKNKTQIDANKNTFADGRKEDASISLYMKEDEQKLMGSIKSPILKSVVAFVKDSANREVVTTSTVDRIDGSSAIKDIEVVITPDELQLLELSVSKGNKFVLMYTEGREDDETNLTK